MIVGGGPAGLAAAVYGASEGLRTVHGRARGARRPGRHSRAGSRTTSASRPGCRGSDLARRATDQARRLGAELLTVQDAVGAARRGRRADRRAHRRRHAERATACSSPPASPTASSTRPGFDDAHRRGHLLRRGADRGALVRRPARRRHRRRQLRRPGGGATSAATRGQVTMLVRGDSLEQSMSHYLIEQIAALAEHRRAHAARRRSRPRATSTCARCAIRDADGEREETVDADASCSSARRRAPTGSTASSRATSAASSSPAPTRKAAGWPLKRDPYLLETTVPGVFVAGDVRARSIKRVASAVGEGSMAVSLDPPVPRRHDACPSTSCARSTCSTGSTTTQLDGVGGGAPTIRDVAERRGAARAGRRLARAAAAVRGHDARATSRATGGTDADARRNHAPTWIGAIAAITEDAAADATSTREGRVPRRDRPARGVHDARARAPVGAPQVMREIGPVMRGINAREQPRAARRRWARWPPGSRTSSTTRPRPRAARRASWSTRSRSSTTRCAAFVEAGDRARATPRSWSRCSSEALERCATAAGARRARRRRRRGRDGRRARGPRDRASAGASPSRSRPPGSTRTGSTACTPSPGRRPRRRCAWVAATLTARELAAELRESTERMSELVKAIKTYAYMDRGELVEADVHEGLESTLIMLGHKLKHTHDQGRARLRRDAAEADRARLRAQPGLDEPARQRDRRARRDGHDHDDARGPTTAAARSTSPTTARASRTTSATRIFDPFFTTKAPGNGTGPGPGHRAADRRGAPRRLADVRHRRGRHDVPRLAAPARARQAMSTLHPPRPRSRSPSCRRRSRAARTASRPAASGCTCASAWSAGTSAAATTRPTSTPRAHARGRAAPDHPLAGAGRGLVLVLRGRGRDADPADHGARRGSRPRRCCRAEQRARRRRARGASLHGGPVSCTPTGRPRSSKPTGTAHVGSPARSCGTVKGSTPSRKPCGSGCSRSSGGTAAIGVISRSAAENRLREGRADALALGGRLDVLGERHAPRAMSSRAATSVAVLARARAGTAAAWVSAASAFWIVDVGRLAAARPSSKPTSNLGLEADDGVLERAPDAGLQRAHVQVRADRDPRRGLVRRAAPRAPRRTAARPRACAPSGRRGRASGRADRRPRC